MASTSGSMGMGDRRQRSLPSKKRRLKEQGQRMEIVPTVALPVAETHAATRRDLRRLSTKVLGRQELKWTDVYAANAAPSANVATVVHINPIAQGAGGTQRVGTSCQVTSIQGKMEIHMSSANTVSTPPTVRILVLCDSEVNGGLPASGDVLDLTTITDLTLAPYNITQLGPKQRFKILVDNRATLRILARDSSASPFYIYDSLTFSFKKSIKRIAQYSTSNTNGAIGGMQKNSLILMFITDTAGVLFNYGTRVIFKDD